MKRPMIIIRFGTPIFHPVDQASIYAITDEDTENASGIATPMGYISIVMTDKSADDIASLYHATAEGLGQQVALATWPIECPDVRAVLPFPGLQELVDEFKNKHITEHETVVPVVLSLNDLLDKISREGQDALSPDEFSRLKEISNQK